MKNFLIDVPVALIFFNRPEVLAPVFECVRKARPSKLFLIQDGARKHKTTDAAKVQECRNIVKNIDWDCNVTQDYSDVNLGCGQRIFTGLKKAFMEVDRLVIVEDDIAFGESFLPFCAEMLERYKDDQRIHLVSGMNHIGVYGICPNSYFFAKGGGAIWGWATWKRCWDEIEWDLPPAEDKYIQKVFPHSFYDKREGTTFQIRANHLRNLIKSGSAPTFWSFHNGYYAQLQNRINIVPKFNLISNLGLTAESAHGVNSIKKIPSALRCIFNAKIYEMPFPLKHPQFVLDDQYYMSMQNNIMKPKGVYKLMRYAERLWIKLFVR